MKTEEILADVLIIGGGPSALFAAIKAKENGAERVTLVCKAVAGASGCAMYIDGNIRDWQPEDTEALLPHLVAVTRFMSDQYWLEQTIREMHQRIDELRKWGVQFIKEGGKEMRTGKDWASGGKANANVWLEGGPFACLWTLRAQALRLGVNIIDRVMVTDLLTADGRHPTQGEVVGAIGFHVRKGDFYIFKAKAIVLSTGGSAIPGNRPPDNTGDGSAMAIRVGAVMKNADFMRFLNATTLCNLSCESPPNYRDFGVRLVNVLFPDQQEEKDFCLWLTAKHHRFDAEKSRNAVRIEKENVPPTGPIERPVWDFGWRQNFRECSPRDLAILNRMSPRIWKILEKGGVNLPQDMYSIVEAPFSVNDPSNGGGVSIDRNHESSIAGLFAAGIVADISGYRTACVSGAMVAGAIAGTSAAEYAKKKTEMAPISKQVETLRQTLYSPMNVRDGLMPSYVRQKIMDGVCEAILDKGVMVNEASLNRAIDALERIKEEDLNRVTCRGSYHGLMLATEIRSMLTDFPLHFRAAILRKESRFLLREDYPYQDNKNWLKFINARLTESGETEFWTEDVPSMKIKPGGLQE